MDLRTPILICVFPLALSLQAQCVRFSEGKDLFQLQQAIRPASWGRVEASKSYVKPVYAKSHKTGPPASVVFLPKWSAESLPFFCRIEHQWGRQQRIPLKFRLGSVEYVDWLEGK
ncbi:MAG TPA: hypothetical protein VK168_18875 [Saprospiraceae bacterium]|nr:hypothetical protein [Saprospiraceae bacterium]